MNAASTSSVCARITGTAPTGACSRRLTIWTVGTDAITQPTSVSIHTACCTHSGGSYRNSLAHTAWLAGGRGSRIGVITLRTFSARGSTGSTVKSSRTGIARRRPCTALVLTSYATSTCSSPGKGVLAGTTGRTGTSFNCGAILTCTASHASAASSVFSCRTASASCGSCGCNRASGTVRTLSVCCIIVSVDSTGGAFC